MAPELASNFDYFREIVATFEYYTKYEKTFEIYEISRIRNFVNTLVGGLLQCWLWQSDALTTTVKPLMSISSHAVYLLYVYLYLYPSLSSFYKYHSPFCRYTYLSHVEFTRQSVGF